MSTDTSLAQAESPARVQTKFVGVAQSLDARVDVAKMLTPEHYAVEREAIFRRAWLPIGHTDDLPEPGSYFVYDVPTFNASLLVVRGDDGQVRVFHNACRHRGNKLVRSGAGKKRSFMCGFHGWSFSSDGALKVVTDHNQFDGLEKADYGLSRVTSEVWENLIFVNFDETPRESLQDWLGPEFFDRYQGYWDLHEKVASYSFDLNCNWHLAVNSFTEGYHTMYIHKNTARDYQGGKINPQRHRPHMELTRRHHRFSAPGNPDHEILPVEGLAIKYGRKLLPAFDFDFSMLPAGVNPSRYEYWAFDNIALFPNMVVLCGNHYRVELTFWPIDGSRTRIYNSLYNYKTKNLGERLGQAYFRARGRDVLREDLNTLEAQQQGLVSGGMPHVILSRQETALKHHFAVTENMLRGQ
ncbi:3-phenylpropionate/cinnamic acid dioxygenase subunit alpha [Pigmentiphaga humi]|uniref:3-phenylpropionate/cinnamic acid dioxygenase subunit alpha n=1 Tax=Pigmentiphaga humi TaxID=2478468 RepID=A0A3P4AXC5_9BURK|nr:aromatic ring-hydroxylating dioxygenase subunit alpha [Pigmentiphaga humi]VCU68713.1 3-phenylpropionate/cinnamic acid dioxygenase subunit alpha [Pigmentiphaga humi]